MSVALPLDTNMEYRFLGPTGLKVSALSLGGWITYGAQVSAEETTMACMKAAWEAGINFFDTAEVYASGENEVVMGNCIKKAGWKREDLVISTKLFWGGKSPNVRGLSRKHIIEGINASLKRLQLDYVDILFCHRPDIHTPIEETVRALNWVIDQGKTFYWGTSEWSAEQIREAHEVAKRLNLIGPVVEQPQYSMLHRTRFEGEYHRLFKELGLGSTIWSPLASGLLTGKYADLNNVPADSRFAAANAQWLKQQLESGSGMNGLEEKSFETICTKVKALQPIAAKLDCTLAQLALAWCLKNPNVSTVITGASKPQQVVENLKSLEVAKKLDDATLAEIDIVLANKPKLTFDYRQF